MMGGVHAVVIFVATSSSCELCLACQWTAFYSAFMVVQIKCR